MLDVFSLTSCPARCWLERTSQPGSYLEILVNRRRRTVRWVAAALAAALAAIFAAWLGVNIQWECFECSVASPSVWLSPAADGLMCELSGAGG